MLFATVITGHPALGDAPETVAGVSSLGVLHAPGYPAYVLAAHAFTLLVPVGTEAFRVNLFSLVCASLAIAGVHLLARRCGAARWASAVAALCLGAGAGFWFYAGYAKHDMFSGLVFLISLHVLLAWVARPTMSKLVTLAAALAVGLGSSWPLMVLLLPAVGFALFVARAQLSLRALTSATATGLVIVVGLYGFVMVRAAENPPLNWGGATNVGRLFELVRRADFTPPGSSGQASAGGSPSADAGRSGPRSADAGSSYAAVAATAVAGATITTDIGSYAIIFAHELGVLGLAVAAYGLLVSLRRRRGVASYPLLITFVVNLVGAAALVGTGGAHGSDAELIQEGFLMGCYFVLACWLAIGATELIATVNAARLVRRVDRRAARSVLGPLAAVLLALALLAPSIFGHWSVAHRAAKPFADRYAATAFSELPPRAAVFVLGAELAQPLIYRQVVDNQRHDVVVIAADGLSYDWYRQQLSRRLGRPLPARVGNSIRDAERVAMSLRGVRPVYLDPQAAQSLTNLGYRPAGLLSQLAGGRGPAPVSSPSVLDRTMRGAEQSAGMPDPTWNVWPNGYLALSIYSTAALEVARAYYAHRDAAGVERALRNVLSIEPGDQVASNALAALAAGPPPAP